MVHHRREAAGDIPILGARHQPLAAEQLDAAVSDRLVGADLQRGTDFGIGGAVRVAIGQGARRARPLLIPADALDAASFSALSVLAKTAGAAGRA